MRFASFRLCSPPSASVRLRSPPFASGLTPARLLGTLAWRTRGVMLMAARLWFHACMPARFAGGGTLRARSRTITHTSPMHLLNVRHPHTEKPPPSERARLARPAHMPCSHRFAACHPHAPLISMLKQSRVASNDARRRGEQKETIREARLEVRDAWKGGRAGKGGDLG